MQKKAQKFIAVFQELFGTLPSNSTLSDRIKIQKIAYLLQLKGLNLNCNFSWYIHGVFSSDLWNGTLRNISSSDMDSSILSEFDSSTISDLKLHFSPIILDLDSDKLELISSILFWSKTASKEIDDPELIDLVRMYKGRFSPEDVKNGILILKKLGFN